MVSSQDEATAEHDRQVMPARAGLLGRRASRATLDNKTEDKKETPDLAAAEHAELTAGDRSMSQDNDDQQRTGVKHSDFDKRTTQDGVSTENEVRYDGWGLLG